MQISFSMGVFYAKNAYPQREVLKKSGFKWHPAQCACEGCRPCAANVKNVWWTEKATVAARFEKFLDPYAKSAIAAHEKALQASKATDSTLSVPAPKGLQYLPYQLAGVEHALIRSGVINADEMGLGKTIQALGLINKDETLKNVLVICPANLRINWKREAEKWLTRKFSIHVVEGDEPVPETANFVIVNYDRLNETWGGKVVPTLASRRWDLMIADEAQKLSNPESQRTIAVCGQQERTTASGEKIEARKGLAHTARKLMYLSGAPIEKGPLNLYPILTTISTFRVEPFWEYAKRYCAAFEWKDKATGKKRWNLNGASNMEELHERLRSTVMIRRKKDEVLSELPLKRRQVIVLPRNKQVDQLLLFEQEVYKEKERELLALRAEVDLARAADDTDSLKIALSKLTSAEKVPFHRLTKTRQDLAMAKVPYIIEHVERMMEAGIEKIVIFAHHLKVVSALQDHFGDLAVTLVGPTTNKQEAIDRFQDMNSGVKIFIGGMTAAGIGVTLTASSNVVFAEMDWTPATITQAEDRCHRLGQKGNVLIQHLVFDESLDARMAQVLVRKQEVADKTLDGEIPLLLTPGYSHPTKYPSATGQERHAAKEAMQAILTLNGKSFEGADTSVGATLAKRSRLLTDGEVWLAKQIAFKYKGSLPAPLVGALGL